MRKMVKMMKVRLDCILNGAQRNSRFALHSRSHTQVESPFTSLNSLPPNNKVSFDESVCLVPEKWKEEKFYILFLRERRSFILFFNLYNNII